jgi:hypothetical protein
VPLTTRDAKNIAAAFQGARPDCRPRTCKLPECGRAPGHSLFAMRALESALVFRLSGTMPHCGQACGRKVHLER